MTDRHKVAVSVKVSFKKLQPLLVPFGLLISLQSTAGAATALCCSCGVPMVPNQPGSEQKWTGVQNGTQLSSFA